MRGRKPKPTHLKLVTGNPGRRPLNKSEPKPILELPTPPAELSEDAAAEWGRVLVALHKAGLLSGIDRAALAAYCQAYGRWVKAERAIAEMGKRDPLTGGLIIKTTAMRFRTRSSAPPTRRWPTWCGMRPSSG